MSDLQEAVRTRILSVIREQEEACGFRLTPELSYFDGGHQITVGVHTQRWNPAATAGETLNLARKTVQAAVETGVRQLREDGYPLIWKIWVTRDRVGGPAMSVGMAADVIQEID